MVKRKALMKEFIPTLLKIVDDNTDAARGHNISRVKLLSVGAKTMARIINGFNFDSIKAEEEKQCKQAAKLQYKRCHWWDKDGKLTIDFGKIPPPLTHQEVLSKEARLRALVKIGTATAVEYTHQRTAVDNTHGLKGIPASAKSTLQIAIQSGFLTDREREVLLLRHGAKSLTYAQIGCKLGITRQRACTIEKQAIRVIGEELGLEF